MSGAPRLRRGEPVPLTFHLGTALAAYTQALMVAPRADSRDLPWFGALDESADLSDLDRIEVAREIGARLRAMVRGLEIWQEHPDRRALPVPPAVWQSGCSRLLDYGAVPGARAPAGPPVLVVPSLINRAYILDLAPGRSLLRWLAGQGLRPLLLEWGEPGPAEAAFDVDGYGAERLRPALARAQALAGRPVPVVGYCMGGTLAVGLAARAPDDVAALVTIGAPWDFASTRGLVGSLRAMIRAEGAEHSERILDGLGAAFGLVPASLFQALFALVNPMQAALKFQKLARLDPASPAAALFVAIEDWVADGVAMPVGAAKDLLIDWQIHNLTATGAWRFLGAPVEPARVRAPALIFSGQSDNIAPPPLARPLGRLIPGALLAQPRTGHVGMIVGSAARAQVWRPMADFLAAHVG